jgi:hypothetical protein
MKDLVLNHPFPKAHPTLTQTLKVQKVSPTEMVELHKKGFFYYCDEKYSPRHKCRQQNFFHIDASTSSPYEYIPSEEAPNPKEAQPSDHVEAPVVTPVEPEEPVISLHALSGISIPTNIEDQGIHQT